MKVTLTVEDTDEGVKANVEFDPPREEGAEQTPAENLALRMMHTAMMASAGIVRE